MRPILLRSRIFYGLLSVLLLSLTCFYSNAQASEHRVTINGIVPLKAVFKAIKKQTGFAVMYNTNITMLNQEEKVTVDFKETPLDEVLTFLLRGKGLGWTYNDDVVVIHKKEVVAPKKNEGDSTVTPAMLTGKVTDAAGSPLPGVTVQVKGTMQGTTTDADGKFALAKVANGEVLVISSVGFETRAVTVKGRSILAQMNVDVSKLDETVVIAYGETTRRLSTGNIATVKAKDIEKQPVNNPLLALQGRVPGLFITQANGLPGSGLKVRIQGENSLRNGNNPLYVIDGIPYPSEIPGFGGPLGNSGGVADGYVTGTGSALSYINPSDIESIDILKDADATAIYGSRAANGAILITTKKGKAGKTSFDINLQHGWGEVTRKLNMLNTPQYLQMRHEAFANDNINPTVDDAPDLFLWDTTRFTDWQNTLIGGTAQYTNVNASLSGGTAAVQYVIRGTYQRETAVFPGNFSDRRGGVHFNINSTSAGQKFHGQLSGSYYIDNNQLPSIDLTTLAVMLEPNAPGLHNADGTLNWMPNASGSSTWTNPLANLSNTYEDKTSNLIANATFSYRLLPSLELRSSFGYNNIQANGFVLNRLIAIPPELRPFSQRSASYNNRRLNSWIVEPQLRYERLLGEGKLEILLGATLQHNLSNGESILGFGYNSDLVMKNIQSAAFLLAGSPLATTYKYTAVFSRINYNWRDKYIINLTARRDGSSRFGVQNQFSNFSSVGAAWIFTEENFIKQNIPFMSFGKVRGSYGITGSDQIKDYSFMSLYNPIYAGVPYQGVVSILPYVLPNPYLEWEATRKLQFGLDLGFINDRVLLNMTYARNRSSNQLITYPLPSITGQRGIYQNFPATVQNTSWEFSLNTANLKTKNINWSSTLNLTIPKNKLAAFPDLENSTYSTTLVIGQPISVMKLFHFLGVDPSTGEYIIADIQGKPTSSPDWVKDLTVYRSPFPKFYGGIQNSISYKNIQLDLLFQFVSQTGRNIIFNNGESITPGQFYPGASNQPVTVSARWQKPGDITSIQRYGTNGYTIFNALNSDAVFADASYIRLKNLSISWRLPERWHQKAHVQNCRIYLQGQNLLTITSYKGLDPENSDVNSLPPLRVLTIGVQMGL